MLQGKQAGVDAAASRSTVEPRGDISMLALESKASFSALLSTEFPGPAQVVVLFITRSISHKTESYLASFLLEIDLALLMSPNT